MAGPETNPEALALHALVWTLGDAARADRLLALTGLDAGGLRARAGEPALLAEAKADLARAPRPERWVPKWLA